MSRRTAAVICIAVLSFTIVAQGCSSDGIVAAPVSAETSSARFASAALTVDIQVSPSTIVLKEEGEWVTVHADIPYGDVASGTVSLNSIPATSTFADALGDLVAKFTLEEICAIVSPPEAVLTLTGTTAAGEPFEGADTVRVTTKGAR
jgi:acyl-CoA synthetase (AMP-forming)/AMP-acid ligase II